MLFIEPDADRRMIAGASSFAVMRTGYATLWWRMGGRPTASAALPRLAALFGAGALLRANAPRVAAPLTAYGVILGAAAVLASDPALAPGAESIVGVNVPNADRVVDSVSAHLRSLSPTV